MEKSERTVACPVCGAVREVRLALGDTQQQFAGRLNMAISTVVRYELTRAPKGEVLVRFMTLAESIGRADLAEIFRGAISAELGYAVPRIGGKREYRPEGHELHDALESVLYLAGYEKERAAIIKHLKRAQAANLAKDARAVTSIGLANEALRRIEAGESTKAMPPSAGRSQTTGENCVA